MNLRATILACCMLVVPGLALCSHHIPAGTLSAVRRCAWDPVASRLFGSTLAEPPATVPQQGSPPLAVAARQAPADSPGMIPAVSAEPRPRPQPLETLARLGATEIMTGPAATQPACQFATCRVPIDADGQLQRLFHASGPDADAALGALAAEVVAWRDRTTGQAAGQGPVTDRARALRF